MTKTTKALLLLAAAFAIAGSAAADTWFDGGVKENYGTHDYNGVNAYGELGLADFSIKPMFQSFHLANDTQDTADASKAFNTYSLRAGYDTKLIGVGVTGGVTPSVDGYNNKFAGADATLSITPTGEGARERINGRSQSSGPAQGQGLARIDLGAAATYTEHTDHFGAADNLLGSSRRIAQTDLTGSVGVSILSSLLSVDVTKSVYDHKPGEFDIRAPRVENIVGLTNVVQGFPNINTNVKILFSLMPLIKPYASYTHTTFQAGEPNSNGYTFGLDTELAMLEVSAGFEHYVQTGQPSQNYVSVGANIRF